ncbi:NAD(P)-binding protein [Colletotrichum somersetense]|nr:NAD(P)-binding protein [Colletotrichum somersetense]
MVRGFLASRGKVLAHAAAGGVGQAAALLDQDVGAEIFVTVGSDVKRRFLAEEFAVPPERIFSSGGTSFVESIQRKTGGKGVVVVVKSLAGGLLHPGFDYLAKFGRFMQIGKRDIEAGRRLAMTAFARSTSFKAVGLIALGS